MKTSLVGFLAFGLSIIVSASQAQDSTATLLLQEEVAIFSKPTILSEFEAGIDADYEQKRMLNLGIGISPLARGTRFPGIFTSFDQKLNTRNAIRLGFTLVGDGQSWSAPFVEYRYYFDKNKKGNNFNGNYIGLAYSRKLALIRNREIENQVGNIFSGSGPLFYDKSVFGFSIGTRIGELVDYGVTFGLNAGKNTFVNDDANVVFDPNSHTNFFPFLSTYYNFSINLVKGGEDKNCEYMKCFEELDSQWKITTSNLGYIDFQRQSAGIAIDYEHRIGESFFTMNYSVGGNFTRETQFESYPDESKRPQSASDIFTTYSFRNNKVTDLSLNLVSSVHLRHYLLKKKAIAKGESIKNLSGLYWFIGADAGLSPVNQVPNSGFLNGRFLRNNFVSPSFGGGVQTKIGSRHFMDIFGRVTPLQQEGIVWGFKFGLSK